MSPAQSFISSFPRRASRGHGLPPLQRIAPAAPCALRGSQIIAASNRPRQSAAAKSSSWGMRGSPFRGITHPDGDRPSGGEAAMGGRCAPQPCVLRGNQMRESAGAYTSRPESAVPPFTGEQSWSSMGVAQVARGEVTCRHQIDVRLLGGMGFECVSTAVIRLVRVGETLGRARTPSHPAPFEGCCATCHRCPRVQHPALQPGPAGRVSLDFVEMHTGKGVEHRRGTVHEFGHLPQRCPGDRSTRSAASQPRSHSCERSGSPAARPAPNGEPSGSGRPTA
jgi:hypothetical protein